MRLIRVLPMLAAFAVASISVAPTTTHAQVAVGVSVTIAPPPLPVYVQPPIPADGYLWMPGYWAYGPGGYYWVPGTWVLPPEPELLWTPAYWSWENNVFIFHRGYWGPRVGFYGGINYGFGYSGFGYEGGYWDHGHFSYNRAVNNIRNVHVTNIYTKSVVNNVSVTRVSYNGGAHGTNARPSSRDEAFEHEHHVAPTSAQEQHERVASSNRALFASSNHGHPAIAATARPAEFKGRGTVPARGAAAPQTAPAMHSTPHPQAEPQMPRNAPVMHSAPPQAMPQPSHNAPGGGARPEPPHETRGGPPEKNDQRGRDQRGPGPDQNGPHDDRHDRQ